MREWRGYSQDSPREAVEAKRIFDNLEQLKKGVPAKPTREGWYRGADHRYPEQQIKKERGRKDDALWRADARAVKQIDVKCGFLQLEDQAAV